MRKTLPLSQLVEAIAEASSIRYNNLVYELQRKKKDVIVLSLGESFFDIPFYSFTDLDYVRGYHYSHSRGIFELREKISRFYEKQYGVSSDPNTEVLVTAGSKAVIYMALRTILCPDDEVIIFEPAWVSYTEQVRLSYAVPMMVPHYEGVADINKYVTERTKAVIINNPNNPSGKVYSKKELKQLYDFAKRRGLYILSDEAYSDFVDEEPFHSMAIFDKKKERVIVVNSLSKNMGMSGLRIGYVIANEKIINAILKLNQHIITCPATLVELYVIKYLDAILKKTFPQIKKLLSLRKEIGRYMDSIGLERLPGTGTFYFTVSIVPSKLSSEEFATRLLKEDHVATVPGLGYGKSLDSFLRVGIGTESPERIKKGLDAIRTLITKTS
ncbi:MAG: aminotransferase [Candidatus Kaiserbacteria bacterium GW2011_GWC2_52_8b]|uniref:Aminotransferase n=2 Tax=Candidatus Kaiseribacteriota TaxID=1752734 RepID=A0A0G1XKN6_9BACT|nr:MAG: aminotransferase [Candidatus Kaiserbacteria bacterium GW2011_GWA2_52_12]KKW31440.1 MAG: aminotransferase [Candidatus Kaiserbacteria bacterium GW2011_GWC2_52_8b]